MATKRQRKKQRSRRTASANLAAEKRAAVRNAQLEFNDRMWRQAEALDSAGTASKKHHWVPKAYMSHWANKQDDKRIRTTATTRPGASFLNVPAKVATRKHLYRIELEQNAKGEVPPLAMEALLGHIESVAAPILRTLVAGDTGAITEQMQIDLAVLLAFQKVRSPTSLKRHLEVESDFATNALIAGTNDDEVRELFESGQYRIAREAGVYIAEMGDLAITIIPFLLQRTWVLFSTSSNFVTCDEPVVLIPAPGETRARQPGIRDAGAVVFPVGPKALLVLFRNDLVSSRFEVAAHRIQQSELNQRETAEINLEVAMAAHSWIFETPDTRIGEAYRLPDLPEREKLLTIQAGASGEMLMEVSSPLTRWADPPWLSHPLPVSWWWTD